MKKESYNPYCKVCGGCGEDGCCLAINCKQLKNGKYCTTYLKDLQFAYLMYKNMYEFLKDDKESVKKIDKIFDKNWNIIYNNK